MPLLLREKCEHGVIRGIWQVTEPDDYFLANIKLYKKEIEEISTLKSRKKTEWLASRYLLHLLSERKLRGACLKDEYGKPYLDGSNWFISMSHSHDIVAVAAAEVPVGVDIQYQVSKIDRIAKRFLSEDELSSVNPDYKMTWLHVYWGAKESMYKAYGRKSVDYRSELRVEPFSFRPEGFQFHGSLIKKDFHQDFLLKGQQFHHYIFIYAIQK